MKDTFSPGERSHHGLSFTTSWAGHDRFNWGTTLSDWRPTLVTGRARSFQSHNPVLYLRHVYIYNDINIYNNYIFYICMHVCIGDVAKTRLGCSPQLAIVCLEGVVQRDGFNIPSFRALNPWAAGGTGTSKQSWNASQRRKSISVRQEVIENCGAFISCYFHRFSMDPKVKHTNTLGLRCSSAKGFV